VHKLLAALVLPIMIVALHVEDVEVGIAILVEIHQTRVAAPRAVDEADGGGDVLEAVAAAVVIENAGLRALGVEMAGEGVLVGVVEAAAPLGLPRVFADVDQEEV